EVFLLDTLRGGGAGCITATGNVNPGGIRKVFENWETPEADALQAAITKTRKIIQARPMVPALKAIVAHYHNDPAWATVRPPMVPLDAETTKGLIADLDADEGFTIAPAKLSDAAE
ncbi:MAG: dihydrodipicolinate synthase family protein, partial [Rickettsiales bacterium]